MHALYVTVALIVVYLAIVNYLEGPADRQRARERQAAEYFAAPERQAAARPSFPSPAFMLGADFARWARRVFRR